MAQGSGSGGLGPQVVIGGAVVGAVALAAALFLWRPAGDPGAGAPQPEVPQQAVLSPDTPSVPTEPTVPATDPILATDINLAGQTDRFLADNAGADLSDTTAFIWIGGNDYGAIDFSSGMPGVEILNKMTKIRSSHSSLFYLFR